VPEILAQRDRTAAKSHVCDYCGEEIQKGEVYDWTKLSYDRWLYEWKSHKKCAYIASALWEYADPDEGMTEDDFQEACAGFCHDFVCPSCPSFNWETGECEKDRGFCTDKIYSLLQTHELRRDPEKSWEWRCTPKKEG